MMMTCRSAIFEALSYCANYRLCIVQKLIQMQLLGQGSSAVEPISIKHSKAGHYFWKCLDWVVIPPARKQNLILVVPGHVTHLQSWKAGPLYDREFSSPTWDYSIIQKYWNGPDNQLRLLLLAGLDPKLSVQMGSRHSRCQ